MARIPQLVALAAFLYAIVIVIVVVLYLPPFVTWSVWFYRLLLAAYPVPFREEYGREMVQLFRDTARDEYRRRGLRGLLVVWLRTVADFSVSVVRQHREQPAAASSESVLLRDLLQQWRQFGSVAFSATTFSTWYALHLLRLFFRRTVLVWATLTTIAFGLWMGSMFKPFTLWHGTPRISTGRGIVWIRGLSEVGKPIAEEQFQSDCRLWRKMNQSVIDELESEPRPWQFSFVSDIPGGIAVQYGLDQMPILVKPYKTWELRFPSLIFPAFLLGGTIRAWRRRNLVVGPAMQSA